MGPDRFDGRRRSVTFVGDVLFGADEAVAGWVAKRIPGFAASPATRALGIIKGGRIVGGVTFDNWNGVHIEAAIAARRGVPWLDRQTLHSIFYYPFVTLGCMAISVSIPSTNIASLTLATKLGFEPEAMIKFAAHDGSTLVILKMYRDRCRWIQKHGQEIVERTGRA
jgi:RimJ/RimL family protein N-acetyltransferase